MSDEFFFEDDDAFALEDEMLMLIPQMLDAVNDLNKLFGNCETQSVEVSGIVLRDTFSDQFGFLPVYDHEISDDEIIKNLFKTSEAVKGFYKNYLKHTNTGEIQ